MRTWLKKKRIQHNLTQAEVAEKAQVSRTTFAMYEQGERTPTIKNAKQIAKVLEFEWILFFDK
ncbi:helix-turn-helix transcriptional regulator [Carnobacterium maltaromaticum]|uniref:helix-turn-helix transcriptional regulator n=1 Tax=Carnobacterium maltaromaticum TaxID=2751 RepID=UPI0010743084|nr:helix-turn-helix transcriptional regulator [Carnobacterium maltaromaticum]MDT1944366.1 helix-turn-helix transcriptional regulator [Carnobacterium maltaromaticum]MDT1997912.1 helix-turn-helix transcriptional regulator [Carnobacterium maltaromaticum]TFJ56904.1 transcriptional regulator [Carnobacterium maltaromaticum]